VSQAGIATAEMTRPPKISFRALAPDVISVSPLHDNVLRPEALLNQVRAAAPVDGNRKRRRAALMLPDYAVRVTVLDFDDFPADAREQASLVRFRLKRSVPFDVDSSSLGVYPQPRQRGEKKTDVAVAVAPLEIVARYEAPFRQAGFHIGWITTSSLAAIELVPPEGLKVLAKRTGRVLSLAVLDGVGLKLFRSIELAGFTAEEVLSHVFPTCAYVEDQLSARPGTLLLCGFGAATAELLPWLESELNVRTVRLSSPWGEPGEFNAGLLGYLEALKEA
jgi:type IV pilus assembly protein PilM